MTRALLISVCLFIIACPGNRPPDTPAVPSGPTAVAPGDSAEFRFSSRDPEDYSVSFRCAWGDGDTSGWSLWVGAGETASLRHAWRQVGRYEVAAQARDAQEALSGWSEPLEVLVGNPPRRPTRPDGPRSGWTDTSHSYTTVATDLDADDIRYVFDWGDGVVETTAFYETGRYATLAHAWTRTDTFEVTVRALDRPGLASAWSETLRVAMRDINGPGVVLWRFETGAGAAVAGVPAIDAAGRVLFGAGDGFLRCVDANGVEVWSQDAGAPVLSSPAVGDDGSIVFGAADGRVHCLSAAGGPRWTWLTGGEINSSPALGEDGAVYVGSDDGHLYCLGPDGSLRWSHATGGAVRSSPALGPGGSVCFGSGDGYVYALDSDGALLWRHATGGAVDASPAIGGDGKVYVVSTDGWLYALDPGGTQAWREEVGAGSRSSPAVASDGNVYVGTEDGRICAFYPTGGPVWQVAVVTPVRSSPLVDSDLIVHFGSGRRLYAVDSYGEGGIAWFLTLPADVEGSVAVTDGVLYVGDSAGSLWAVRGSGKLDNGAWPKFRSDARNTGRAGSY
ncbi:MAG: PQQ-binding-like beta-propeller repeat protein [bacterium]